MNLVSSYSWIFGIDKVCKKWNHSLSCCLLVKRLNFRFFFFDCRISQKYYWPHWFGGERICALCLCVCFLISLLTMEISQDLMNEKCTFYLRLVQATKNMTLCQRGPRKRINWPRSYFISDYWVCSYVIALFCYKSMKRAHKVAEVNV